MKPRQFQILLELLCLLCISGCEGNETRNTTDLQPRGTSVSLEPNKPAKAKRLTIGSTAPAMQVGHWITNGTGTLSTEIKFEPGNVYVVEFWATTCGPCIQTIPHLAELQKKYSQRGLKVIGVTSEPLDLVTPFLEREIRQAENNKTTIGEVAKAYHLAADPDGSVDMDYMLAAGIQEIPMAFVVGKRGLIEWIGQPLELEDVIQAVIEDRWDRKLPQP